MDQPSRQRARGIRTIGRLTMPQSDDVLLAQWPSPADPAQLRRDVAISSAWCRPVPASLPSSRISEPAADVPDVQFLLAQYEDHQLIVIRRILETIDAELESRDSLSLAFEPPSISLEVILCALDQAVRHGDLSSEDAGPIRAHALRLGESIARLWALVDLHRSGHISKAELRQKRDLVLGSHERPTT
jgi:hypothetical protein